MVALGVDLRELLLVGRVHVFLHHQLLWVVDDWVRVAVEATLVVLVGAPDIDVSVVGEDH